MFSENETVYVTCYIYYIKVKPLTKITQNFFTVLRLLQRIIGKI